MGGNNYLPVSKEYSCWIKLYKPHSKIFKFEERSTEGNSAQIFGSRMCFKYSIGKRKTYDV